MLDELYRGQQDCSATHFHHHFGCYRFQSIVMLMTECAAKDNVLMARWAPTFSVTRMRLRETPQVGQLTLQKLSSLPLQVRYSCFDYDLHLFVVCFRLDPVKQKLIPWWFLI
jgi:hypothetical protein